jgi:hypothetical protein
MSTIEDDGNEDAISEREKARCRRHRRPSVQFIDKNLIRRRSSGLEKQAQYNSQQPPRLPSINSNDEVESTDVDQQQPLQKQDCENSEENRTSLNKKKSLLSVFFLEDNKENI